VLLDVLAYSLIAITAIVVGGFLLLFIVVVVLGDGLKKALPLLGLALLLGGFVWALFRLGVM